jgi:HEAT repeat protein
MDEARVIELVKAMCNGDDRAVRAILEYVEKYPPDAPYLLLALRDALSNLATRDSAAFVLAEIGPRAEMAVPDLIEALRYDPTSYVGVPFVVALGCIAKNAEKAVPALIEALDVEDPHIDLHVAEALGKFGPDARAAIPHLKRLRIDSADPDVRDAATHALDRISSGTSDETASHDRADSGSQI